MLIDTHAHLNDKRLLPEVEQIARNMHQDNLNAIINVGYDLESSIESVRLADTYQGIYAAVGLHPHDAKSANNEMYDYFIKAVENPKVVAIGEIGLDHYYDYSPRDIQAKVFLEQLEIAHSLKMPVVIHLRDAYEEMYDLLKDNSSKIQDGLVLHCYSGSAEMVRRYNEFNPYYSFGGAITFAKNKDKVILEVPKDRLMLETDCPYMTPIPHRGKLNVPAYVQYVADKLAEFLSDDREEIERITTENARRFFRRLA